MTKKQVFDHFGGARKVAETLGIATASVYQWGDRVPLLRQYQIEKMTKGKLKAAKNP
jgi:DNA-binding transcriptional regulator YdaS (Cro superfamily)